ncbi:MAG: FAD-dependent oxidoreductase [Bacteroidales bacterium]
MILAGRAIGADHDASAAIRVTPIAMAIGQGGECGSLPLNFNNLRYEILK